MLGAFHSTCITHYNQHFQNTLAKAMDAIIYSDVQSLKKTATLLHIITTQ